MLPTTETDHFLTSLDHISQVRTEMVTALNRLATILSRTNNDRDLGLSQEIADLTLGSQKLSQGVFRLMVLGDMKRGKSTFLNALLGERLLPSDVNPCTALLTILRYGPQKKVTIHFLDSRPAEILDFETFKQQYTIPPTETKSLAQQKSLAFPTVSHAVVEYPLPLLAKGIEIIDSPGLNDTEARNELSLSYIQNCHAILFMMRATQPCTLAERRYLETYIQGRGLSLFFLINAWDQVKDSLIDPEDLDEIAEAEGRLRQVFRNNLADYCQIKGETCYEQRVFPISALDALRRRLKQPMTSLEGTGLPPFMAALNRFLTQDRAVAEFQQALTLATLAQGRLNEGIERRIPLLNQSVIELKDRILSVAPEFEQLVDIRDRFQHEIQNRCDLNAKTLADSLKQHILNLETNFEQDFLRYQSDLNLLDFISPQGRERFNKALAAAFEQYLNDQLLTWAKTAEQTLNEAFRALSKSAASYGASYGQITDRITQKLTGQPVQIPINHPSGDNTPGWTKWAMGLFSLSSGNLTGTGMAATGLDWEDILLNLVAALGVAVVASAIFGVILGPITFTLVGLGLGTLQADKARKEVVKATKQELTKHLPRLANQQWQPVYNAVKESFERYEAEVIGRIDTDITVRKDELEKLLAQKQAQDTNRKFEIQQLKETQQQVAQICQILEQAFQPMLASR